jgi:hypothetical protein
MVYTYANAEEEYFRLSDTETVDVGNTTRHAVKGENL